MSELPQSWTEVDIVEVLEPNENGKPFQQGWSPQCESAPAIENAWGVLKTTAIQHGEFWPHENKALPIAMEPRPHIEVRQGDILMICAGPRNRCGVACLVEHTRPRLMMSGKMYRFRPNPRALHPKYLAYLIQRRDSQTAIDRMKTGISDSGLNLTHDRFAQLRIPLAPLPEQRRIVAKIEELFSELDASAESLTRARAQLKTYRQSLLKAAFEGKLTADWRAANVDKLETPERLLERLRDERNDRYQSMNRWTEIERPVQRDGDNGLKPMNPTKPYWPDRTTFSEIPTPPKGWTYAPFECLADSIRNGISQKPDEKGALKIFRISAVRPMEFDLSDFRLIREQKDFLAYKLARNDLVFTRYNGSRAYVGVGALYRGDGSHVYPDKLIRCKIRSALIDPEYLEKAVNCGESRAYIEKRIRTTAGQAGVSGGDLRGMPVPICAIEEQAEINRAVDSRLSLAKNMDSEIESGLTKIAALRQSILKRAFSGRLVTQDPTDEPAASMLARIGAESADAPARNTRRKQPA